MEHIRQHKLICANFHFLCTKTTWTVYSNSSTRGCYDHEDSVLWYYWVQILNESYNIDWARFINWNTSEWCFICHINVQPPSARLMLFFFLIIKCNLLRNVVRRNDSAIKNQLLVRLLAFMSGTITNTNKLSRKENSLNYTISKLYINWLAYCFTDRPENFVLLQF